jgi:Ca2+-binding RTX toxin-like protein
VIQLANGAWAIATVDDDGNVEMNGSSPNILIGTGANALFTETAKNAGGVDYASSKSGTKQTAASLASDTADGPTGPLAWEDFAAKKQQNGTYTKPGDADYNDAVFDVTEVKGKTLNGGDGPDALTGGKADDVLYGAAGNDVLKGDSGDDRIEGGLGADKVTGGGGSDTFVFLLPSDGVDTIADFHHSEGDLLEIFAGGFGGGLLANTPPSVINVAGLSDAASGTNGAFIFDKAGQNAGTLYWDAGGDRADALAIATLQNVSSLLPSDFHIV